MSHYEWLRVTIAQWGLVYFGALFVAGCAYALWPSRKHQFEAAARLPLSED
jgi:cytochrome c oxidase cbb3-type subunit IV